MLPVAAAMRSRFHLYFGGLAGELVCRGKTRRVNSLANFSTDK